MNDDITPGQAFRGTFRWAPVLIVMGIVAVLGTAAVFLVGWQLAGWFQQHGIQRQFTNTVNSQPYQTSLLAEMQQHLTNVGNTANDRLAVPADSPEQAVMRSSQLNELEQFCSESTTFIPGDVPGGAGMEATISANCNADGSVAAVPQLANPVPQG